MRVLPTEVKAIAKMLNEPADSAEDLARSILLELEQLRSKRRHWVVITRDPTGLTSVWGTYSTVKEAERAIGKDIIASRPGTKGYIGLMHYNLNQQEMEDDTQ